MQNDTVVVDGQTHDVIEKEGHVWYNNGKGETVPYVPKSVKAMAHGQEVEFTERVPYLNHYGLAVPREIRADGKMAVRYIRVDRALHLGVDYVYPVQAQADTVANAKRDHVNEMVRQDTRVFSGGLDSWAMGFFARHGRIDVVSGPKYFERFPADYERWTGDDAKSHLEHGYTEYNYEGRWGYTLRMGLDVAARSVMDYLLSVSVPVKSKEKGIEFHSNNLIRGLFMNGFLIGRNEKNVDKIRAGLTVSEQKAFDEGFNCVAKGDEKVA